MRSTTSSHPWRVAGGYALILLGFALLIMAALNHA